MSDEFLSIARQEIQADLDSLERILAVCHSDSQIYERSKDIESHLHKIKGLAPMMNQNKVGEIAQVSDLVLKYMISNGVLDGSCKIILESIQKMNQTFSGHDDSDMKNFINKIRDAFPQVFGL